MNQETDNIIQGLSFLFTKYPDGRVEGGGDSSSSYISFILPFKRDVIPQEVNLLENTQDEYLELLGWNEYMVDYTDIYGQSQTNRLWRFYTNEVDYFNTFTTLKF
jgi:hypothetical protein